MWESLLRDNDARQAGWCRCKQCKERERNSKILSENELYRRSKTDAETSTGLLLMVEFKHLTVVKSDDIGEGVEGYHPGIRGIIARFQITNAVGGVNDGHRVESWIAVRF